MKQRRKPPKKRTPRDEPPPTPRPQPGPETLAWHQPLTTPQQRKSNIAALTASSGTVEPILPPGEAADKASFKGEVDKAAQHEEMLSRITILEAFIAELPKQPVGIGHNQPLITKDDVQEIKQAIAILKAQPVVPTALDQVRASGSIPKKVGKRLKTYLDAFMLEAAKSGGKEAGKRLIQFSYWWLLLDALMKLAQSVTAWLH